MEKNFKAIYKGYNGSLGYTFNMEYELLIRQIPAGMILIKREDGTGWCEYETITAFLNNWDDIRHV
jgi:hypothetical protein